MVSLLFILVLAGVYCFLFNYIPVSPWFNFLWAVASIILAFLTYVLFIIVYINIIKKSKPNGKFRYRVVHDVVKLILMFVNVKIKYIGKENVPDEPFVCYPNHQSAMDVFMVHYGLNSVCSAVGKDSIFKFPVLKQCQYAFGCISLDRGNDRAAAKSIIEAVRNIRSGLSYILFPEGTRNKTDQVLLPFRDGAFKLVTKSEAKLLPCTIVGATGFYKRKSIFKRVKVKIIYHKPISFEEYKDLNTTEISSMVGNIIRKELE